MNSLDTEYFLGTAATITGTAIGLTIDAHLRQGQSILENFTVAKVQRAALYAIGCIVPVITAIASREKSATLLSLVGTAFCLFGASKIRDYDDAKELEIMKTTAEAMNFKELTQTHGLDRLAKYQMVNDLSAKFQLYFANQPFSLIIREHSLEQIAQYRLAPISTDGFLHDKFVHELSARKWDFLRERNFSNPLYTNLLSKELYTGLTQLNIDLGNIDKVYDRTLNELHIAYSERTEVQIAKFAERERRIPALARQMGEQVSSQASNNALGNAVINAVWDGNTNHIVRDAGNGFSVAEAAGKYAEQAELERLRAELRRDRENPILIARGAQEQKAYDEGVSEAKQAREARIAMLEETLHDLIRPLE